MSYTGFAGYHCHPTQLSTQLSLMTSNTNNSTTDSPCCSSSGSTDSRGNAANVAKNTNMNLSANDENHIQSAVQSNTPLSSSSSSVCALTTPYDSRIISGYPRLAGFYANSYTEQNSFYTSGANPFYSSFGNPYDLKDPNANGWSALPQSSCYLYDPIYSPYGERYGAMDGVARRKNVTRDSTTTLKAWLSEHRKNPYPTKGEKIMLAIITKMTLTQVSTWFANARRRLKKENKMTWEPRNRCDDNDDDILTSDEENDNKAESVGESEQTSNVNQIKAKKDLQHSRQYMDSLKDLSESSRGHSMQTSANCVIAPAVNSAVTTCSATNDTLHHNFNDKCNATNISKPKIWSLAETAIEDKPKSPLSHLNHNLNPNVNLASPLLLTHNTHPNPLSASTPNNMSSWCHPTHSSPYTSVNPYGTHHYMPSLGRHFSHQSSTTSLPPQADTPPQTPPALKLASMQLLNHSESGALTALAAVEQVNCVQSPKLITYGSRGEQMVRNSGNTSPPTHSTQIYGTDFRITSDTLSETRHSFSNSISSSDRLQIQDNNNHNNTSANHK